MSGAPKPADLAAMAASACPDAWDLWETQRDPRALEAVHVRPGFGPAHTFIEDPASIADPWSIRHRFVCWCHPDLEMYEGGVIVVHQVMH